MRLERLQIEALSQPISLNENSPVHVKVCLSLCFCFALLATGCAYRSVSLSLPEGTNRLWIAPVQNQTSIPELDTRLRQHLRNQFAQHHTLQLVKSSNSQVILYITLNSVSRSHSLAKSFLAESSSAESSSAKTFRQLNYDLQGQITLHKTTDRKPFWGPKIIKTQYTITIPDERLEDPVLTDRALDQTLLRFATQVKTQLLNNGG